MKITLGAIILLIFITGCMCIGEMPDEITTTTTIPIPEPIVLHTGNMTIRTTTTTINPSTPSTLAEIRYKTVVRYKEVNITLNVTGNQRYNLKNLKPKNCHSSCCSYGYFKAKVEVLNILDIEHGYSFYEGESRRFQTDYNEDTVYLEVKNNNFTSYVELNKTMWYLEENNQRWILRKV